MVLVVLQVHLVIEGVPKSENGQHGDDNGRRRGVLAVEVVRLDSTASGCRRRALGELGVKSDEGVEVRTLPGREDRRRGNFGGYKTRELSTDEGGVHRSS